MKKLELKHVQCYPMGKNGVNILLPKHQFKYGEQISLPLNGVSIGTENELQLEMLTSDNDLVFTYEVEIKKCKLILHPLSDLTKEIEVNGEKLVPYIELLRECCFDVDNMSSKDIEHYKHDESEIDVFSMMFLEVQKLFEWQFDVYGLIENGLAMHIEIGVDSTLINN